MADKTKNICPKCGKGQTVCTYRGENPPHCHHWSHDCTNPTCGMQQGFNALEKHLNIPGFPADSFGLPTTAGDDYVERIGPGAKGGCPGSHN